MVKAHSEVFIFKVKVYGYLDENHKLGSHLGAAVFYDFNGIIIT